MTDVADARRGVLELASAGSVLDTIGARDARLAVRVSGDGAGGSQVKVGASYVEAGPLAAAVAPALGFELALSAKLLFPSRLKAGGSSPKAALVWTALVAAWASVSYGFFALVGSA